MKEDEYRNVVIDGDRVTGESRDHYNDTWTRFSGCLPLMRIGAACDIPGAIRKIMREADGYGAPGLFPSGYDWSGIRDSSTGAIERMDAIAKAEWGNKPWPWERDMRHDRDTAYLMKVFLDNLSGVDEGYSLDDYRLEQYSAITTITNTSDDLEHLIDEAREIERRCHILDLLEVGERFTAREITFTRIK